MRGKGGCERVKGPKDDGEFGVREQKLTTRSESGYRKGKKSRRTRKGEGRSGVDKERLGRTFH